MQAVQCARRCFGRRKACGWLVAAMLLGLPACGSPERASVDPAINKDFSGSVDVNKWVERFEGESREIYQQRQAIVVATGVRPGESVADIGAGTGFFTLLFAEAVGPAGRVHAVEIAPQFLDLIRRRADERGFRNVTTVRCSQETTGLPQASADLAFVCDTYHHFEKPAETLRSIHAALRPGGRLVLIDFIRIPGKSREWVLEHVRAGEGTFCREIEAAGFERMRDVPPIAELSENYFAMFRRK